MNLSEIVSKNYVKCDSNDSISKVIGAMTTKKCQVALVFDSNKFLGVVSRRKMLKVSANSATAKISSCIIKPPILNDEKTAPEAAMLVLGSSLTAIPYVKNKKIVGVVKDVDLALALYFENSESSVVGEVVLDKPSPLGVKDKISTAIKIVLAENTEQVLLFEKRMLLGVVSITDLLEFVKVPVSRVSNASAGPFGSRGATVDRKKMSNLEVKSFATMKNLHTIGKMVMVRKALQKMKKNNSRNLIVKENEKVFGVLSVSSILKHFLKLKLEAKEQLQVSYSGLSKTSLSDDEQEDIKAICANEVKRFCEKFNGAQSFKFRFKEMKSSGNSHKYSVNLRLQLTDNSEVQTQAIEWDLIKAVKSSFKSIVGLVKKESGKRR